MKNKIFTLILLVSPERSEILLGMKKRGFGVGKWNGFGGKVTPDESIFSGALRELKEEAGIYCPDLRFIGDFFQFYLIFLLVFKDLFHLNSKENPIFYTYIYSEEINMKEL